MKPVIETHLILFYILLSWSLHNNMLRSTCADPTDVGFPDYSFIIYLDLTIYFVVLPGYLRPYLLVCSEL